MITPEEIQKIRDAAKVLDREDRPDLARRLRETGASMEAKTAKDAREAAAKLQAAADVIRSRFGAGSLEDAVRKLANETLEPFEGVVEPEPKPVPKAFQFVAYPAAVGDPLGFPPLPSPARAGTYIDSNGFRRSKPEPIATGFVRPKSEDPARRVRREGYQAGIQASINALHAQAREPRGKGFAKAADYLAHNVRFAPEGGVK